MYQHTVQYYETDKMAVTHHSNYIRWMEEARIHFLSEIGWDFEKLESMGIVSPIVSVSCNYKKPTTFADLVQIEVKIEEFNGIRLKLSYEMKKEEQTVCTGTSEHCFLNTSGMPIRMKKMYPDFDQAMMDCMNNSDIQK